MKQKKFLFALLAMLLAFSACTPDKDVPVAENASNPELQAWNNLRQRVVVCNRASGDISVVNAANNNLINTITMPDNGEPMYAVHVRQCGRVFVGDRANNRVVAFNEHTFAVEGFAPAGDGVFHMWASPNGCQLWVNNDVDNTTTVIDPYSLNVIATVSAPADIVADGGKPHDVVVNNNAAFITYLGLSGDDDFVVKFNAQSFNEVHRAPVGKDPHVIYTRHNNFLYVAAQNGNSIHVLRRGNLSSVTNVPFDGAHGIGITRDGRFLYVTDLPGNRVGVLRTSNNNILSMPLTSPFAIPHNIAVNRSGSKIFVTHSGAAADKLSIYTNSPRPNLQTSLTLGTNPFGLVYYAYRN